MDVWSCRPAASVRDLERARVPAGRAVGCDVLHDVGLRLAVLVGGAVLDAAPDAGPF